MVSVTVYIEDHSIETDTGWRWSFIIPVSDHNKMMSIVCHLHTTSKLYSVLVVTVVYVITTFRIKLFCLCVLCYLPVFKHPLLIA